MNPNGKIPVLELAPSDLLSESNAILFYLAQGSSLWPTDPRLQAEVLKWMFFDQYSHEPCITEARFIVRYLGRPESQESRLEGLKAGGEKALAVMEQQLKKSSYLCSVRRGADHRRYSPLRLHSCGGGGDVLPAGVARHS